MSWWEWVAEFQRQAQQAGDRERLRLVSLLSQSYNHRERDPARALALCAEGRLLAQRLGDAWWVLGFQVRVVHQLVHDNRDFRQALDLAVAAVLEARKPSYDGCPLRPMIHEDLLAIHFCIDPDGYAEQIETGFREIEGEIAGDLTSRLHLLNLRRWWAEQAHRPDEHHAAAQRVLALIADHPRHHSSLHYSTYVYNGLCRVCFARQDGAGLEDSARQAEEASRTVGNQVELANACLWRAVSVGQAGDHSGSQRLRRRGVRIMDGLGVPPADGYFEALSRCHEMAGQLPQALAVRRRELQALRSQGRTSAEVHCHSECCRLLVLLGQLTPADLNAARDAAQRLRFPGRHLAALDRFAGGA